MVNPYWLPTYVPAAVLALVAGVLPMRPRYYMLLQFVLLVAAAIIFHVFVVRSVVWAYQHPFNPSDGAPRVFASLFGWLVGLVWPILPTYAVARLWRWLITR